MAFKDIGKPRKVKKESDPRDLCVPVGDAVLHTKAPRRGEPGYGEGGGYRTYPCVIIENQETVDIETDLTDLADWCNRMLEKHGKTYTDLRIEIEREPTYYDEIITTYRLYGWRKETQVEVDHRLQQARAEKARTEDRERKEFERLQKKFAAGNVKG